MSAEIKADLVSNPTSENAKTEARGRYKVVTDFPLAFPEHLEIRIEEGKGRGLYTTKAINPGDTVIATLPLAHALLGSKLGSHCSACCRKGSTTNGTDLKTCTSCKVVKYCDAECQNRDWSSHRKECKAFQRCAKDSSVKGNGAITVDSLGLTRTGGPSYIPGELVRALGRVMWKKKADLTSAEVRAYDMMHWYRHPAGQESIKHLCNDLARYIGVSQLSEYTSYGLPAVAAKMLSSATDRVPSSAYAFLALGNTASRFTTNAFEVVSHSQHTLGLAISPLFALINHSCTPNTAFVCPWASPKQEEPCLKIVAHKRIEPGEEILLSYTDITVSRSVRQAKLERFYGFACKCTLCEGKMGLDPREMKLCDEKGCDGAYPYPSNENPKPRCFKCGAHLCEPDVIRDLINSGCEGLRKAQVLQYEDIWGTVRLTDDTLNRLQAKGFPPSSHPMLALLQLKLWIVESLMSSASFVGEVERWRHLDELARFSSLYAGGLRGILNKGHPLRAFAMMRLAQDLAHWRPGVQSSAKDRITDEKGVERSVSTLKGAARLREACDTMVLAVEELAIAFGKDADGGGGLLGKQARQLLEQMKRELRMRECSEST